MISKEEKYKGDFADGTFVVEIINISSEVIYYKHTNESVKPYGGVIDTDRTRSRSKTSFKRNFEKIEKNSHKKISNNYNI